MGKENRVQLSSFYVKSKFVRLCDFSVFCFFFVFVCLLLLPLLLEVLLSLLSQSVFFLLYLFLLSFYLIFGLFCLLFTVKNVCLFFGGLSAMPKVMWRCKWYVFIDCLTDLHSCSFVVVCVLVNSSAPPPPPPKENWGKCLFYTWHI